MEKSITTTEYRALLRVLRRIRIESGITQVELAEKIDETQSFVSKVERGETRIDLIQLRTISHALGTNLAQLVDRLEQELKPRP